MKIIKPTLIIDKERVIRNIDRMARKIAKSSGNIRFRPHFKTHQSARIGEWFREYGVTAITVSSVDMAQYFAQNGWKDITIGVLVNPLEIESIDRLAKEIDLDLLIDSPEMADFLHQNMNHNVKVWIKIDTGYHRTGLEWDQKENILAVAEAIEQSPKLQFKGLLTHSGHSYKAGSVEGIQRVYDDTVFKMNYTREYLKENGIAGIEISIGDTPTCSVQETFFGIDEVRCGNFVYYDVMQLALGSCKEDEIAAAVACPIIAVYPKRNEIVIYGGAVHLSNDFITDRKNRKIFGVPALPNENHGWGPIIPDSYVSSLSQEHGIIKTAAEFIKQARTGDIMMILPVHSCLTANLLKDNFLFPGEKG